MKKHNDELVFESFLTKEDILNSKDWTMFMEVNGVKMYTNGKEIRDEFGHIQ